MLNDRGVTVTIIMILSEQLIRNSTHTVGGRLERYNQPQTTPIYNYTFLPTTFSENVADILGAD